jgi:hypothetical protein
MMQEPNKLGDSDEIKNITVNVSQDKKRTVSETGFHTEERK